MKNNTLARILPFVYASLLAVSLPVLPAFSNVGDGTEAIADNTQESDGMEREKTLTAQIDKAYASAKFLVTCENAHEYDITVKSPKGQIYSAQEGEDKKSASCAIQNVDAGTWTIHIRIKDEDTNTASGIGAARVKIEGSMQTFSAVSDDIEVAQDITGLKMFFRDETFVCTWNDDSVGDVIITVTDEATQQQLASDTVSGGEYTLDVDPVAHKKVIVTIVPSVSYNIEGAQKTFTLSTKNSPSATVSYDGASIVNTDTIPVVVKLEKPYRITAFSGKKEIYESDGVVNAGEKDLDLKTDVGDNHFSVYVIDPDTGYERSTSFTVTKDVTPPTIYMSDTYDNVETRDRSIVLKGSIDPDYSTFTVNSEPVKVEGDQTFAYEYALKEGENKIHIEAADEAGNISSYDATVIRVVPKGPDAASIVKLLLGFSVLGAGVYFLWKTITGGGSGQDTRKGKKGRDARRKTSSGGGRKSLEKRLLALTENDHASLVVTMVFDPEDPYGHLSDSFRERARSLISGIAGETYHTAPGKFVSILPGSRNPKECRIQISDAAEAEGIEAAAGYAVYNPERGDSSYMDTLRRAENVADRRRLEKAQNLAVSHEVVHDKGEEEELRKAEKPSSRASFLRRERRADGPLPEEDLSRDEPYEKEGPERKRKPPRENRRSRSSFMNTAGISRKENVTGTPSWKIWQATAVPRFVLKVMIPVFAILWIFNSKVAVTMVMSGSMTPKLAVGSTAAYSRDAYKNAVPERGDIILFRSDELGGNNLAKRVIGIPGDEISFHNGYTFINGTQADESAYIADDVITDCGKTFTVPDGCVFVMGDNREDSYDSRHWNNPYIPYDAIIGKYIGGYGFNVRYEVLKATGGLREEEQRAMDRAVSAAAGDSAS